MNIIDLICGEYAISSAEFLSDYKYGSLPEARHLYCLVLSSSGHKPKEISEITGYSLPRVTYSLIQANNLMMVSTYFRERHYCLVKSYLKGENN